MEHMKDPRGQRGICSAEVDREVEYARCSVADGCDRRAIVISIEAHIRTRYCEGS